MIKNLFGHSIECFRNWLMLECWNFKEWYLISLSKLNTLLSRYFSLLCFSRALLLYINFPIINIVFIANNYNRAIMICQLSHILQPLLNILETFSVCHIINYYCSFSLTIMTGCHRMIFLFTGSVEDIQFYTFISLWENYCLNLEIYSNCCLNILRNLALNILMDYVCLSHRLIPNDNNLKVEGSITLGWLLHFIKIINKLDIMIL